MRGSDWLKNRHVIVVRLRTNDHIVFCSFFLVLNTTYTSKFGFFSSFLLPNSLWIFCLVLTVMVHSFAYFRSEILCWLSLNPKTKPKLVNTFQVVDIQVPGHNSDGEAELNLQINFVFEFSACHRFTAILDQFDFIIIIIISLMLLNIKIIDHLSDEKSWSN